MSAARCELGSQVRPPRASVLSGAGAQRCSLDLAPRQARIQRVEVGRALIDVPKLQRRPAADSDPVENQIDHQLQAGAIANLAEVRKNL